MTTSRSAHAKESSAATESVHDPDDSVHPRSTGESFGIKRQRAVAAWQRQQRSVQRAQRQRSGVWACGKMTTR